MPFVGCGGTSIGALTMREHWRQRAGSVTIQQGNVAKFSTRLKQSREGCVNPSALKLSYAHFFWRGACCGA